MQHAMQYSMIEWSFASQQQPANPPETLELDVILTDPAGKEYHLPAFWSGGLTWRVRYTPLTSGVHHYTTRCSDTSNTGLHGQEGAITVEPYSGKNTLLQHGMLRISADRRYLEHSDGTPFFWLGDTWWMGLCRRLEWPGEFQQLVADRVQKGFTVIQIVAGLYPDMPPFDQRGANEAGFPLDPVTSALNPAYFDMADLRIDRLVRAGLVPCIVGCWGYYLDYLGMDVIKRHWRNLVARYAAYPVVWCLAGEALMPFYQKQFGTPEEKQDYRTKLHAEWTEIARYVREIDPYRHPITIHPNGGESGRQMIDPAYLDIDMLQTGHSDRDSMPGTIRQVQAAYAAEPPVPVINAEVCYEGIGEACRQDIQRYYFWMCMLSGACGHTYGANGLWQLNRREQLYGPSPHGLMWGDTPWDDAAQLPGAEQLGIGKRILERYEWWRFEPHQEWIEPHATPEQPRQPFAAGIPGQVRVCYIPARWNSPAILGLEQGSTYKAAFVDPRTGQIHELGLAQPNNEGTWHLQQPVMPALQDWVLVMECVEGNTGQQIK